MNKILAILCCLFFVSCASHNKILEATNNLTLFYDKADSDFSALQEESAKVSYPEKLLFYNSKFRNFFIGFARDSLQLTSEILSSDDYTLMQKEELSSVIRYRQEMLYNAFVDKLDYIIRDSIEVH